MNEILKVLDLNFLYSEETKNSEYTFGLKDINIKVIEKDLISVIGKNGSGKSTLIKLFSRINNPDSGKVFFRDAEILKYDKKDLSKFISYLPQMNDLTHFDSDVIDFLMLGRYPYKNFLDFGYTKNDTDEVLICSKITGIENLLAKKINTLSGGERQKVLLTLSLVQLGTADDLTGKLLIADEPLTHLDINHQIEIMNILKTLNEKGLTIIIVLHDLNLALKYTNKAMLISNGRVVKFSETDKVITEEMLKEHFFIDSKILNYEKNFFINYLPN
ncbi:MAG TPA: ABC transporter ATP-binding protein [Ignavibacteria bacterium]|nr:ABC transporter ATP-binding protein [Ignavibacteria bacterium]